MENESNHFSWFMGHWLGVRRYGIYRIGRAPLFRASVYVI